MGPMRDRTHPTLYRWKSSIRDFNPWLCVLQWQAASCGARSLLVLALLASHSLSVGVPSLALVLRVGTQSLQGRMASNLSSSIGAVGSFGGLGSYILAAGIGVALLLSKFSQHFVTNSITHTHTYTHKTYTHTYTILIYWNLSGSVLSYNNKVLCDCV